MIGKVILFLCGVVVGCAVVLLIPRRSPARFSHALKHPIVVSSGSKEVSIPEGTRLYSDGKLTKSPDVGNMLYIPVAFSPEETASLVTDEQAAKSTDSYYIKGASDKK